MSDYKLELLLRNRKYKIDAIILQTGNNYPRIDTESAENCLSVFFEESENEKGYPVTQLVQLKDKYREEIDEKLYLTHVSLEEMSSIYSNLTRIFSCSLYIWVLIFDNMKLEEFWEYTEKILTFEFRRLTVHGGKMSNDVLAKLMDKTPEKAELYIDSHIPLDYSHPKALQFHSVDYEEARWLKIEELFNIRNSDVIKLGKTNIDCDDVNRFLNYWSDCDKDMMEEISISLKEGTEINKQEIFRNLIVISPNDDDSVILIKARNMGNRKFVVGALEFSERQVIFSAWDPFKEDVLYEYLVLKLVYQKSDCEEKIRKMEKEFRGWRDPEKKKIQLELEELERKLAVLNRDFVV
ncbi:unnamed protein product [Caenorhabditis nigoni]